MGRKFEGKTYWVVGASEGLGRALAVKLSQNGARLVISARNTDRLAELAQELGDCRVIAMDVSDPSSVQKAVTEAGSVDGLIYSVGLYEPTTAANWDPDAVEAMNEANFTGALRLLGRVIPGMIERDAGHVVLIGSLAGYRGLPGAIGYGASKAALMHLAETIHADTRNTGVSVQVANPGFIKTRLTDKNEFDMPMIMTPDDAANRVLAHMKTNRFSVAFPRPFSLIFTLGRFLPARLFYGLMGGAKK